MANFWTLVGFELKKIVSLKRNRIALALGLLAILLTATASLWGRWMEGYNPLQEIAQAKTLAQPFAGREIDTALLLEAAEAYQQIPPDLDIAQRNEDYQTYAPPYQFIEEFYGNYQRLRDLTPEQAAQFYTERSDLLGNTIDYIAVSKGVKTQLHQWATEIETPYVYDYFDGYEEFLVAQLSVGVLAFLLSTVLLSSLFSGEYGRTDNIVLSSKHGRKRLALAKIFVGFGVNLVIVLLAMATLYGSAGLIYGFTGGDSQIQLIYPFIPYSLTVAQGTLATACTVLLATVLHTAFAMWCSAHLKSPLSTMGILFVLILLPQAVSLPASFGWVFQLYMLLPANMLFFTDILGCNAYEVLGMVLPPYVSCILFALVGSLLLMPFVVRRWNRHQIT